MLILALCVAVAVVAYALVSGYHSSQKSDERTNPRTCCSVCGAPSVVWEGQYCRPECQARLAKSMDEMHDRFEEMY